MSAVLARPISSRRDDSGRMNPERQAIAALDLDVVRLALVLSAPGRRARLRAPATPCRSAA
jgi:hypothetical protein